MPSLLEAAFIEATRVLTKFVDPMFAGEVGDIVAQLKPLPEDYERVFMPEAAAKARIAYKPLWTSPPPPLPRPGQTSVRVHVAEASEFASGSPRAQEFPGGMKSIADKLQPGLVWVAWEYLAPGEDAGLSFNGLVYLDGRFAWFPKPWRFVDF